MKLLQNLFDSIKPYVEKGAKYERFHTLYEGHRTIFFKPSSCFNSEFFKVTHKFTSRTKFYATMYNIQSANV